MLDDQEYTQITHDGEGTDFQNYLSSEKISAFQKYQDIMVGKRGVLAFLSYEMMTMFLLPCPGALGFFLRQKCMPLFMRQCGRSVVWGCAMSIRNPGVINVGKRVLFDDNVQLDAKGKEQSSIVLSDGVMVGRNTIVSVKNAHISIGAYTNIGSNCRIASAYNLTIGRQVLVAAYVYISAGASHSYDRCDVPIISQGKKFTDGSIVIEDNVWIGAGAKIFGPVRIGRDSIIGAGSVVLSDIPPYSVAVGMPAKVIKERQAPNPQPLSGE